MISRSASTITTISQRGAAMRRQQRARRAWGRNEGPALYCRTNGCTTFMRLDPETAIATCPVCGASRRIESGALSLPH
ncbi:MAG: hypothetical protein ACXVAE_04280 [Candidatus Limnocylindrales bacterium]|jgi:hypothetical protein